MASEHEQEYDAAFVELLESVWGEGFLSPGGPDEVARILDGLDLRGARVLDIGCGTGGAVFLMAERDGVGHVVGVDVGRSLIEGRARANRRGLDARVSFRQIESDRCPSARASSMSSSARIRSSTFRTKSRSVARSACAEAGRRLGRERLAARRRARSHRSFSTTSTSRDSASEWAARRTIVRRSLRPDSATFA
jgi:SAM-dependent methyltransferase